MRGLDQEQVGYSMTGGDVDGDGVDDLLVGAPADDTSARDAGAAYLFTGPLSGTMRIPDAPYIIYGESRDDTAGSGTKIADMDNDGLGELFVGSPTDSTGGSSAGAVHLLDLGF